MLRGIITILVSSTFLYGVLLFGSAGRLNLPMFWVYLAVNFATGLIGILVMVRRSPDLIQYRTKIGASDIPDRLYQGTLGAGILGNLVIAGLDAGRFHWSGRIPLAVQMAGLLARATFGRRSRIKNLLKGPIWDLIRLLHQKPG